MPKITTALLASDIDGYTDAGQAKKDAFHRAGKKFLRELATDIDLAKGEFDIRSNMGGIAVSGEITLHGESIYVQMSEYCMHRGSSIMYRTCEGHKDYCGGQNHFVKMSDLTNLSQMNAFIDECRRMTEGVAHA